MPQRVSRREQVTINYTANSKDQENLSRGELYRYIMLRLQGQLTVSAANNTSAKTNRGDEWACIRRIELIANGRDTLWSVSGNTLRWWNFFKGQGALERSTSLGDGATLDPSFDSYVVLPIWSVNSRRPIDTVLNSATLSSLTIDITWGTHTDINADATGFTVDPTLVVSSTESFGIDGPFAQKEVYEINQDITASNPRYQVDLPVGRVFRSLLFNTTDSDVDVSNVLNRIKIISGNVVFTDVQARLVQAEYAFNNGLNRTFTGAAFDDVFISDNSSYTGWYFLDFVTDGLLTEGIDTLGFSEFKAELDVTNQAGTTKLLVVPEMITPVRAAAAA